MVGLAGFGASLQTLLDVGIENISNSLHEVMLETAEELRSIDAIIHSSQNEQEWSGILSFDLPGQDAIAVKQHAKKQNVILNARNGHVRISPHVYTTSQDIKQLIALLK